MLKSLKLEYSDASSKYSSKYFNSLSSVLSYHSKIGTPFSIYNPNEWTKLSTIKVFVKSKFLIILKSFIK